MRHFSILFILLFSVLTSCKKERKASVESLVFSNVVILGNSITYAPADASIGWNGSWGMAASSADKDYVHLLRAKFKQQNPKVTVQALNIAAFERDCNTYDFDVNLKIYRNSKPDLLILRIGENVPSTFDPVAFDQRYQALIAYMKTDNPNLVVLSVGSFWPTLGYVNAIMSKRAPYISLAPLGNDLSNYAFDTPNVSDGVKQHPGDKGMQAIADMIWAKVQTLAQ